MPTLAELNELTAPVATDLMHVRRNSDAADPDKRMSLDKIALKGTAQTYTQLQTFNAGIAVNGAASVSGGLTVNGGLAVPTGSITVSPGGIAVSGLASLHAGINMLDRFRTFVGAALTVAQSPVTIHNNAGHSTAALVLVNGAAGGNAFADLLLVVSYGQIITISSGGQGGPAARNYTFTGDAQGVNLTMASGTYTVRAACVGGIYYAA